MFTFLILLMLLVIVLVVLMTLTGALVAAFGWLIAIVADLVICGLIITGIVKLFKKKKD